MTNNEVRQLATTLLSEYGLDDWTFKFDRAVRRLGCCYYGTKTISLSEPLARRNDISVIRNTILHEIAHALIGPRAGHGPKWRAMARSIGAKPQACSSESVTVPPKLVAECPRCNTQYGRHRAPSGPRACGSSACKQVSFGDKVLTWRRAR